MTSIATIGATVTMTSLEMVDYINSQRAAGCMTVLTIDFQEAAHG